MERGDKVEFVRGSIYFNHGARKGVVLRAIPNATAPTVYVRIDNQRKQVAVNVKFLVKKG